MNTTTHTGTPLRQRMTEDMRMRKLEDKIIGLGVMGAPMAANILKGGHELTVYDRSAEAVARLVQAGAKAAANPKSARHTHKRRITRKRAHQKIRETDTAGHIMRTGGCVALKSRVGSRGVMGGKAVCKVNGIAQAKIEALPRNGMQGLCSIADHHHAPRYRR